MILHKKEKIVLNDNLKSKLKIRLGKDGGLLLKTPRGEKKVELKPCFPWATPNRYLAIVDEDSQELGFISSLQELSEVSKNAVQLALIESGFCFQISEILKIEEEFELRRWWVNTESGQRQFQTRLLDWPRLLPDGQILVQDLYGDLYLIKNTEGIDLKQKEMLSAFLD